MMLLKGLAASEEKCNVDVDVDVKRVVIGGKGDVRCRLSTLIFMSCKSTPTSHDAHRHLTLSEADGAMTLAPSTKL